MLKISLKEVYVIDGIKRQLHQQVQTAFDQIARLNEAKQQLIRVNIFPSINNNFYTNLRMSFRICKINILLLQFVKKTCN